MDVVGSMGGLGSWGGVLEDFLQLWKYFIVLCQGHNPASKLTIFPGNQN
jgi:hypothetical protein